jgi:hypothetical protein
LEPRIGAVLLSRASVAPICFSYERVLAVRRTNPASRKGSRALVQAEVFFLREQLLRASVLTRQTQATRNYELRFNVLGYTSNVSAERPWMDPRVLLDRREPDGRALKITLVPLPGPRLAVVWSEREAVRREGVRDRARGTQTRIEQVSVGK